MRKPHLSQAALQEILHYDQRTGWWLWLVDQMYRVKAGSVAGCLNKTDGRWYLKINCIRYSASRLAWYYMTGEWPDADVDHKDNFKINNAWDNLRLASKTQNQGNARARKFLLKGVTQVRTGKYTAQIQKNGIKLHLGTFDTAEQAHAVYVKRAKRLYGEFARIQ